MFLLVYLQSAKRESSPGHLKNLVNILEDTADDLQQTHPNAGADIFTYDFWIKD